jgi:hypothetical protein
VARELAWLILALAGCDRVFQLVEVRDAQVAPGGDGAPDTAMPVACPATYEQMAPNSVSRYRIVATKVPWTMGQLDCVDDRTTPGSETHLAVLSDDRERAELTGRVGAMYPGEGSWWIGYADRLVDGDFRWVTNEPAATPPWEGDDPDYPGPGCVNLRSSSGAIGDLSCDALPQPYICECDVFADQPSNYF